MAPLRPTKERQKLDLHVYMHGDSESSGGVGEKLDQILQALGVLEAHAQERHMAVSAEIAEFSTRFDAATTEIANDLKALRDKIAAGTTLSAEDKQVLTDAVARLEVMGQDPENPTPTEPPA